MHPSIPIVGEYRLCPGRSPGVEGRRPVLAPGQLRQMLTGKSSGQAVRLLGNLFTLCAHAHQRNARMALATARISLPVRDGPAPALAEPRVFLLLETVRDHLRSMALDWPQRLGLKQAPAAQLAWLKGCPLPIVAATPVSDEALAWRLLALLNHWLAEQVLQQATDEWLAQHRAPGTFDNALSPDAADALTAWCAARAPNLLPARCLADALQHAAPLPACAPALNLLDDDEAVQRGRLLALVQQVQSDPDFCQYPTWNGQCVENGPWTRLCHATRVMQVTKASEASQPSTAISPPSPTSAVATSPRPPTHAQRLGSRWFELLELSQTTPDMLAQGHTPLSSGVLVTGPGQALAWCEMARGLLLHWAHCKADGSVIDYKVIAPTEWNFHSQGTLANALSALSPNDTVTAQRLAAAFDPCVACTV